MKKTAVRMLVILVLSFCIVFALFYALTQQYKNNISQNGAVHLMEINRQGGSSISALLQKNGKLAEDIASEAEEEKSWSQEQFFDLIRQQKEIWNADEIYIYTKAGNCYDAEGNIRNTGSAAAFAARTMENGSMFRIISSDAEFAESVHSDILINGSEIISVSVLHKLDHLLTDLDYSPFDGEGSAYLTRQNGVQICRSEDANTESVYNILSVFEEGTLKNLKDRKDIAEVMQAKENGAFLFARRGHDTRYVVLTPVSYEGENFFLFDIIPQNTVNRTMNNFLRNVFVLFAAVFFTISFMAILFLRLYEVKARHYNAEIRSRERLFDLLVSNTSYAYMLLELNQGTPYYISSNMESLFGRRTCSLRKEDERYVFYDDPDVKDDALTERINGMMARWDAVREFDSGYLPYTGGGKEHWLELRIYPVQEKNTEFIGIVQDVTSQYRREENLKEALSLANSANRAKSRFLSNVSHDIRTPLNAIINMARFLKEDLADPEKARRELDIITKSSEHLLNLINDVLDLSRIESGKLSFADEPFDMGTELQRTCEIVRVLCTQKHQTFVSDCDKIRSRKVSGDALRLNQILINVLNNAVKFTPENGQIALEITELPSIQADTVPYRFVIRDNGIGIPAEKLKSIFEPFIRSDNALVRRTEGTGLGLAITKNLVEAMGGSISVSSEAGVGSVFTIELFFRKSDQDAAVQEAKTVCKARFDGKRALVAEDNEINMLIAETILRSWGFETEQAVDGSEAVSRFRGHPAYYYDVIYMDIQMAVMDGYTATREIRGENKADASVIPIIAMTANAFSEDIEKARAAGMNAHVAKPINPDELRRVTAEILQHLEKGQEA